MASNAAATLNGIFGRLNPRQLAGPVLILMILAMMVLPYSVWSRPPRSARARESLTRWSLRTSSVV